MKPVQQIVLIVVFSLFISCEKDSFEQPSHHGKLKRKLAYWSINDSLPPRSISDYEYDITNKLVKIQDGVYSELFEYNQKDQLIRKFGYQIDGVTNVLCDSVIYRYENGNLIFEERIGFPPIYNLHSFQTKYEYENSKLIRKKEYRGHTFKTLTTYEYTGNLCTRENQYYDSIASELMLYKTHLYEKDQLSISSLVAVMGGAYNGLPIQVVYYLYDENGNLTTESAEQNNGISAGLTYFYRYEYY